MSATPAVTPRSSPATVPSSTPAAAAWRLVELPGASNAGQIADVAARSGFVAAASAAGLAGERGMAWTSDDGGRTWTAERLPGSARSLNRLVPWGKRTLAVGEGDGDCPHPSIVEIWVRSAAGRWTAAPADPLFCAGGTAWAATSGSRAVIVGTGSGDVPYAWSSDDGLHWTDHPAAFGGGLPQGVVADGSGFLATGSTFGEVRAWTARTRDGSTWETPDPILLPAGLSLIGDPIVFDGQPTLFAKDPGGAVGILRQDGNGGWRSEPAAGLNANTVSRFVAVGDSLVALGGDDRGPAMWASADGTSWRALALPAEAVASGSGATLTGLAVSDGRAYLSSQITRADGAGAIGALWTGDASLVAP